MTTYYLKPRKPRAKSTNPERQAQKAIVEWLWLVLPKGSLVWAVINEVAARSTNKNSKARFGEKLKAFGLLPGAPDLTLTVPMRRTLFIETKRPKDGVVSSDQQDVHVALRASGHAVGICVDIESARAFLRDEGVPLNEAAGQLARHAKVRNAVRKDPLNDPLPF